MTASSILGRHSALASLSCRNWLVAMRAYFDGSRNSHLALAGFCAGDEYWEQFEHGWRKMLAERDPPAPYLHMTDAAALQEEFRRARGWDDSKVSRLVCDAVQFLSSQSKEKFRGFCCTIDCEARKRLISRGAKIERPEVICSEVCVGLTFVWGISVQSSSDAQIVGVQSLDFFFDQGEKFKHQFEKVYIREKKKKSLVWQLVKTIAPADMKVTPGIQAADMLAWASTRKQRTTPHAYLYLWEIMSKVIPLSVVVIDENTLCQKYT